ncbi:MAG TPA: nuclear transport factor 2 family protein [Allosphingosinicella sp.]
MSYRLEEAAFAAWLEAYKAAWEARDPAAAARLFAADATYHEMPFDAPIEGSEGIAAYWARAVAGQSDVRFTYEILACTGAEGLCHWHCAFTAVPDGAQIDLDGIFRCRFADAAHVDRFQEWWHVRIQPAHET